MSLDGEICSFVRSSKNKQKAIEIASIVFSRSPTAIRSMLQAYKLMTTEGEFISPKRITGKEYLMKRWYWTAERKETALRMDRQGRSIEEIAEALGCEREQVEKLLGKSTEITKISITPPAAPTPIPPTQLPNVKELLAPQEQAISVFPSQLLNKVESTVDDCICLSEKAYEAFNLGGEYHGFYTLGILQNKLGQLAEILELL